MPPHSYRFHRYYIAQRERDTHISEGHTHFRGTHPFQRDTHISEGHTHFTDTITERERDTQNSQVPPHEKRGAHSLLHRYYHIKERDTQNTQL